MMISCLRLRMRLYIHDAAFEGFFHQILLLIMHYQIHY
jgi:hypothetical protein